MSERILRPIRYESGPHPTTGWDQMRIVHESSDKRLASILVARTGDGLVLRKVDVFLDQWEKVTDEEDLRYFEKCFNHRDRLLAEQLTKSENPVESG